MLFGCNYWASHAGIEMWRDWDEATVQKDFEMLHAAGNEVMRVFPLWRDFQPIELARRFNFSPQEILMHNHRLPKTYCGQNGIDEEMMKHFRFLCHCADTYGIKLIVPLITGWMSGRLYCPVALENRDIFTDPLALKWQVKFVRAFVHEMKNEPSIIMWELGNECNCIHPVADGDVAYNWTNMIISAIKMEDTTRPAGSGMHSLGTGNVYEYEFSGNWTIQTQAEICDFLTPHPYPHSCSKPPAQLDAHTSLRLVHHAAFETQLYADIGNRPAFVEEINTFSSGYCNDRTKALFMRNSMFNAWAHGSDYFLWWCGFDQKNLDFPPFDWCLWERENGEYTQEGVLRESAEYCRKFNEFQKSLPFRKLSPCRKDAVCLLTHGQDYQSFLTNSWSSFLMAKLAGFNVRFHFMNHEIPESDVYIMPGVISLSPYSYQEFNALLQRVEQGATLYMSIGENGVPTDCEQILGCTFISRELREGPLQFTFRGQRFSVAQSKKLLFRELDCEVLAREDDGNPVYIHRKLGKGHIYFLAVQLEDQLGRIPHVFDRNAPDSSLIYKEFCQELVEKRIVRSKDSYVTLTEHTDENGRTWVIAVNNGDEPARTDFEVSPGWRVASGLPAEIEEHNGIVFEMIQK